MASLLLLFVLSMFSPSLVVGQSTALYSFCYSIVQSLQTSPYLPFSIYVQGTLNVSTTLTTSVWGSSIGAGYQVVGATGTRAIQVQGKPLTTANIIDVAPVQAYSWNDNLINPTSAAALFGYHTLSFQLDTTAVFAAGPAVSSVSPSGTAYFNIQNYSTPVALGAQFQESDNPLNDGETVVISSQFNIAPATGGFVSTYASCPIAAPSTISLPSTVVAQYSTSSQASFCYTFSSGSGYGTLSGGTWQVAAQGVFTYSGYLGTTISGRSASLLTGVTGQRVYSIQDVVTQYQLVSQTVQFIGLLSPNGNRLQNTSTFVNQASAGYAGIHGGVAASGYYGNNVIYPYSWPWLDAYGAVMAISSGVEDELATASSFSRSITNALSIRLLVANIGVEEQALDYSSGVTDVNYDASFLLSPGQATSAAALSSQCSPTQANLQTYSYCYFVDNSALSLASSSRSVVSAYGTFTATGPVARDGREALLLQSISGVRNVLSLTNNVNTTVSQAIIALRYTGADRFLNVGGISGGGWNKNYIFTSGPQGPIDYNGILFTLSSNVVFPRGTSATGADLDLWWITPQYAPDPTLRYIESPADESENINTPASSHALFQYEPFNPSNAAGASSAACSLTNPLVSAPAPVLTFSFCFYRQSTSGNFISFATGVLQAYSQSISQTVSGSTRVGLALSNVTGVRTFASANAGLSSVSPITGAATGWQGPAEGYSAGYLGAVDQLVYTTAPFLDSRGILVNFNGVADSGNGAIFDAQVVRFVYDPSTSTYTDQSVYNITYSEAAGVNYLAYNLTNGTFNLVADGGASGTSGLVGQQSCGQPAQLTFNFCYTLSSSVGQGWSIFANGTLLINTAYTQGVNAVSGSTYGYQVVGATGSRVVTVGKTTSPAQQIVGVAPVNSFLSNDNVLVLSSPIFDSFSSSPHSLSLQLSGPAQTVLGSTSAASYINLNNATLPRTGGLGFTEAGAPINDGISSAVTSAFNLQLRSQTGASYSCPLSSPPLGSPPSSASTTSSNSNSLSGGAIAGVVIGVIVGVLVFALLVLLLLHHRQGSFNKRATVEEGNEASSADRVGGSHMELTEHSKVDNE